MQNKKILLGICAAVLIMLSIAGCSDTSSKKEDSTQIVKVTEVDGDTITAQTGTLQENADEMPETPKDEMPEDQKPDGTPPTKPSDMDSHENPQGENPNPPQGEPGQNDSAQGQPPQGAPGGTTFEANGETITFSLNDTTNVILEQLQGEA